MTRIRLERAGFGVGDISLIMDCSEKLNKCRRGQIQTEHWDNTAITIEVAVCEAYPRCKGTPYALPRAPYLPHTCLFSTCCHPATATATTVPRKGGWRGARAGATYGRTG